eukprot:scaffold126333_cov24-Phaeocystis_antarctica.AAC.1
MATSWLASAVRWSGASRATAAAPTSSPGRARSRPVHHNLAIKLPLLITRRTDHTEGRLKGSASLNKFVPCL